MKKIVNGKMYDTETAQEVYKYSILNPNSFIEFNETILYKKKNGEFFFLAIGNTWEWDEYAVIDNEHGRMDAIIVPATIDDAKAWGEKYFMPVELYIEVFGKPEE